MIFHVVHKQNTTNLLLYIFIHLCLVLNIFVVEYSKSDTKVSQVPKTLFTKQVKRIFFYIFIKVNEVES